MARSREIRELTRELKEKCDLIAQTLRFGGLASEQDLADYLPGGAENNDASSEIKAWIFCYANYIRFCERIGEDGDTRREQAVEDDVIAALRDAPEVVTLQGSTDAFTVSVYPKSFDALDFIAQRERRIEWLIEQREKIARRSLAKTPGLLDAVGSEITYQYGLIVWSVTNPGPRLPFDDREIPDSLPDWIADLSPTDILLLNRAFQRVNAVRLFALKMQLDARDTRKDEDRRSSWSSFFGTRAEQSHIDAGVLMRDKSLVSQLAAALLNADAMTPTERPAEQVS